MPWRERVRLPRADSWSADQAGVIQDQFCSDRQQVRTRVEDRKAVVCSRPPRGASRKQNGEVHQDRGENRASGIPRSPRAWFIVDAAAARWHRCRCGLQCDACKHRGFASHRRRCGFQYQNDRGTGAAAAVLAERLTVATAAPLPDIKGNNRDRPSRAEPLARGNAEKTASASASDADLLVAVLMPRPDITSVSDLTGKTIAIDNRFSASNGSVRTAIVAAGAPEIQLSEGQTTAINRLVNGQVPAAVLAWYLPRRQRGFPKSQASRFFTSLSRLVPPSPTESESRGLNGARITY